MTRTPTRCLAVALLFGLAGCGARSSVFQPEDGSPEPDSARSEAGRRDGQRIPDARRDSRRDVPVDWARDQARDKFVWPDLPKTKDTWPWPADGYLGTPFGCQTDSDCFGQKCCPTPWNVKLCSPDCSEG